ncbi:MAG: hypothetical protein F8N37_19895 [Telmatospirillum sp.]|nr:hypothetical protein [Telmatospirillum sp.]
MKFASRSIALLSSLLALSACKALDKEEPPLCPRVSVLADSAVLTRFAPGAARDDNNKLLTVELTSFHGTCRYDPEEQQMRFTIDVGIDADRFPAMKGQHADIAYYVAIPAFYPNPSGKAQFPLSLDFSDSRHLHVTDEGLKIAIPMAPSLKDLAKYEVFIGLQLTADELAYNREKRDRH